MPDAPEMTPAQHGVSDELEARVIGWDDDQANVIVQKPDGETVMITPTGEVEPAVQEAEVVDASDPAAEGDPDDYRPPEEMLAVDVRDPGDVYRAMDRNDEELILDELMGRALDVMVYSFESGGKLQTDLSVHGVNETVRLLNERGGARIGVSPQAPIVREFENAGKDYVEVQVYALDARVGIGRWGVAVEPQLLKGKWDKFAVTKALNKAQRNALRTHIPEDFRQNVIALYLNKGQVKQLKPVGAGNLPGGTPLEEMAPPVEGPDADRLRGEIKEVYMRLKEGFGQLVLPPAKYHLLFEAAQRDTVDALERYRDYIQGLLDAEVEKAAAAQEEGS